VLVVSVSVTSCPEASKRAQEKSSRSLILTLNAVRLCVCVCVNE